MEFIVAEDYQQLSRLAADKIAQQIKNKLQSVLGLATGTTPLGLYECLVADCQAKDISFSEASTFNLDEYCGLEAHHPQSYHYFMRTHLFDKIDIDLDQTHVPDGTNPDAQEACSSYEAAIAAAGGIDLQLLGLGHNGHIGFNEPADFFPLDTHAVDLTQSTIDANSRLFNSRDEVPRRAYTMGIGTIMRAREVLVVASGADKASIVKEAFFGPVKPQVPASVLQLHPKVVVMVDKQAGALCA